MSEYAHSTPRLVLTGYNGYKKNQFLIIILSPDTALNINAVFMIKYENSKCTMGKIFCTVHQLQHPAPLITDFAWV